MGNHAIAHMRGEIGLRKRIDCVTIPVAMVVVDTFTVLDYEDIKSEVVEEDSIA